MIQESEFLETQNHTLKSEISRLEEEKKRLMEILSMHQPGCQKQLASASAVKEEEQEDMESKPAMQLQEGGGGGGDFRVPPPPPPATATTATTTSASLSMAQQQQQPSFQGAGAPDADDLLDVKPQILLNDGPLVLAMSGIGSGTGGGGIPGLSGLEDFEVPSDFGQVDPSSTSSSSSSGHFLAKRPPVYTYLDMDSRCVAL